MTALRTVSVTLALALIGLVAFAVHGRFSYPFELEWMEGATAIHLARLLKGEDIYVRPSLDFVPFGYPALYYYACLPIAWFTGEGFTALRLVSVGATIATLVTIHAIVRRTSGTAAGIAAAGAFAGAYPLSDGWYDLGRVDALYVALLAGVYLVAVQASAPRAWIISGAIAAAAFATKQPALLALTPLGLYLVLTDRRAALLFGATFAVLSAGVFAWLNVSSDGWYYYYILELPRLRLDVSPRTGRWLSFWTTDLLPFLPTLATGAASLLMTRGGRHVTFALGLIGAAWLARLEGGAWHNAVMPAYLAAAIVLGLSLRQGLPWPAFRWSLVVAQLALLLFDPRPFRPNPTQLVEGTAFIEQLRAVDRPVLVMQNGYWATAAGLPEFAHGWAVTDVVWADKGETGQALEREVQTAIRTRRFATIIVDGEHTWFERDLQEHYQPRRPLHAPGPLSGAPRRAVSALAPR